MAQIEMLVGVHLSFPDTTHPNGFRNCALTLQHRTLQDLRVKLYDKYKDEYLSHLGVDEIDRLAVSLPDRTQLWKNILPDDEYFVVIAPAPSDTWSVKRLIDNGVDLVYVQSVGNNSQASVTKSKECAIPVLLDDIHPFDFTSGFSVDPARSSRVLMDVEEGRLTYHSEACVQGHVKAILKDIATLLGKQRDLDFLLEMSVRAVRPDIFVILLNNSFPIGVIEVKKPQPLLKDGSHNSPLRNEHILGQNYDYLTTVKHFGRGEVIGIVTTFDEWRFCTLSQDTYNKCVSPRTTVSASSSPDQGVPPQTSPSLAISTTPSHACESLSRKANTPPDTPSKRMAIISQISSDETPTEQFEPTQKDREIYVSPIYRLDGKDEGVLPEDWQNRRAQVIGRLATVILRMVSNADATPFRRSFSGARSGVVYTKASPYWTDLEPEFWDGLKYDTFIHGNVTNFILCEEYGHHDNLEARVWLVASKSGAVAVMKIPKPRKEIEITLCELMEQECQYWKTLYKGLGLPTVRVVEVDGKSALLMPRFSLIPRTERTCETIRAVIDVHQRCFLGKGVHHRDIHWGNVCRAPPNIVTTTGLEVLLLDLSPTTSVVKERGDGHDRRIFDALVDGLLSVVTWEDFMSMEDDADVNVGGISHRLRSHTISGPVSADEFKPL
eukprot:TRINITY_DN127_c1_g2_i3.p1 TRINITY_DN127_c1_g2~~TRINITY_DN127_c1_g2_i3.p1  ORF type:complete len:666 (-),score=96.71 TRINITY_DN127_c1_g2_i3:506-2503(-)